MTVHRPAPAGVRLLVVLLALGACAKAPTPASAPPALPTVTVAPVQTTTLTTTGSYLGEVLAKDEVAVRARVQGHLEKIHFTAGGPVRKGQLLYTIDPRPFEAALAEAKAGLARAEVEARRAESDAVRFGELAEKGLVSRKQAEDSRAQADSARASVSAAEAVVHARQIDLSYTRIVAPMDGVTKLGQPSVGNLVGTPAEPPLATIYDLSSVTVRFSIAESEYLSIFRARAEAAARGGAQKPAIPHLLLADGSTYPLAGRIVATNQAVDAATGTIKVDAEFANPQGLLKPGQFARITGETGTIADAMVIPAKALVRVQDATSVLTVDAQGLLQQRRVEGMPIDEERFHVTSGLAPGERVVVDGAARLAPGTRVTTRDAG
jgi:membrane fusion protein, multidrug efflux system